MKIGSLLAAVVAAMTTTLSAQDIIYLKTGEALACRVDDLTDNIVNFSLLSDPGTAGGSARRTVPAAQVDYIEFDFREGEAAFFWTSSRGLLGAAQRLVGFLFPSSPSTPLAGCRLRHRLCRGAPARGSRYGGDAGALDF